LALGDLLSVHDKGAVGRLLVHEGDHVDPQSAGRERAHPQADIGPPIPDVELQPGQPMNLIELEASKFIFEGSEFDALINAAVSRRARRPCTYVALFGASALNDLKKQFYSLISECVEAPWDTQDADVARAVVKRAIVNGLAKIFRDE
jgi:hypothetical protein